MVVMVAAEFTADATLNSAKFGARAIVSSVMARHLLWSSKALAAFALAQAKAY